MRVVGIAILALARVRRDVVVRDERRGDIVLRRQRIRRAQRDLGAAGLQREREVRGLSGHVKARADAQPEERLFLREALRDAGEHGHLARRPLDPPLPCPGEPDIRHVVFAGFRCHRTLPRMRSHVDRRTAGPSMNGAWTR